MLPIIVFQLGVENNRRHSRWSKCVKKCLALDPIITAKLKVVELILDLAYKTLEYFVLDGFEMAPSSISGGEQAYICSLLKYYYTQCI